MTGENNQLVSDGTYDYEYDKEGNLISQTAIATGKVQEFTWDYVNRLVAVVDKDSEGNETQKVEFTYDLFGRRLSKTVDGEATYFVYDRDNVILDFVENGSDVVLDERYLHGIDADQVLAQEDGNADLVWHLADHLGSVRDLVDNSGNSVNHFVYDSFGNVVSESGTVISRFLFTGREWDQEIERYYYRERFYDSELGRFIEEDPIGFSAGTPNLYGYVENNPINATDPFGKLKVELHYNYIELPPPISFLIRDPYHIDIVVSDKTGKRAYFAKPLNQNLANQGKPTPIDAAVESESLRPTSSFSQVIYDDQTDCRDIDLEARIARLFRQVEEAKITYRGLGPNSNSTAYYVLRNIPEFNYPAPPPVNAVGWDIDPITGASWTFPRGVNVFPAPPQ